MDIGKRIRQLRVENNLTLEELASRSELTKGFLSQLERNLTSPSITTLEDITQVLGVSLEEFFKEKKEEKLSYGEKDYFVDEKEECLITYLVPSGQKNSMEPILLTLKKDGSSQEIRIHEGEEFAYVLQGKIELRDLSNKRSYTLKKGETFYFKSGFRHQLFNKYNGESKVLWLSSPSIF